MRKQPPLLKYPMLILGLFLAMACLPKVHALEMIPQMMGPKLWLVGDSGLTDAPDPSPYTLDDYDPEAIEELIRKLEALNIPYIPGGSYKGTVKRVGKTVTVTKEWTVPHPLKVWQDISGSDWSVYQYPSKSIVKELSYSGSSNNWRDYFSITYEWDNTPTIFERVINGHDAIHFSSENQQHFVNVRQSVMTGMTQGEIFAVLRVNDVSGVSRGLWSFSKENSSTNARAYYPHTDGSIYDGFGSTVQKVTGRPDVDLTKFHIYSASSKSGEWVSRLNGDIYFKTYDNVARFEGLSFIGAANGTTNTFDGDIAEIIFFPRVLSMAERELVGRYLQGKYQIPRITPPSTPANLKGYPISSTQSLLKWDMENATGGTVIAIERKTADSDYAPIQTVEGVSSFVDETVQAGETYFYRLTARNYAGNASGYSNEVSVVIPSEIEALPQTNLCLWLMAETQVMGSLGSWQDMSGKNNHALQPTPAKRPSIKEGAVNGWASMEFAGASQHLQLPNPLKNATEGEVFILTKTNYAKSPYQGGTISWNFGGNGYGYPTATGTIKDGFFSNRAKDIGAPRIDITQWHVYNASSKQGEWIARLNGSIQYIDVANVCYAGLTYYYLGAWDSNGYSSYNGEIAEVLVYDRVLTEEERQGVQNYLNAKYSLNGDNAPPSPLNFNCVVMGSSQVLLTWDGKIDWGIEYIIERRTENGGYEIVGRSWGRSFIDSGVMSGNRYTYRIRAVNMEGASSYSEEIPITFGGNISDARFPVESLRVWFKPDGLKEGLLGGWADESKYKYNTGVAATPANSPTVKANGLGTWPTVVFNGNAQVLTMKEPLKNLAEGEIFVLTKTSNPPGDRSIWNLGGNSGNRYPSGSGMLQEGFMSNKSRDLGMPLTDISKWHVYNVSSKTGEWVARLNGMVQHKDAVNSVYCLNTCYLGSWAGSGTSYIGEMAEVLIFERVLTEAERQGVRNYLDAKYCLSGLESPAAPTQLKGIQVGSSQILLTWAGEVASSVSYLVERRTGTGGYELLGRVTGRSFVDNDALAGQTYSYRVSAANVNGLSEYSNEAEISTNSPMTGVFSTAGLKAWLKPDRLQPGSVGCWSDDSPNQLNNACAIATASNPEAKLNGLGAWPTVKFYGAGTGNTFFRMPSVLTGATEGEVFVLTKANVAKETKYGGSTLLYFGGNGYGYPTSTGTVLEGFFSNRSKDIGAPLVDITRWHVYNASSKAGEWIARLNGEVQYTDLTNVIYNPSTWYIGCNNASVATSYNGEVAEVLVYDRVLSAEERQGVQNYLNAKYSLTGDVPPEAPHDITYVIMGLSQVLLTWEGETGRGIEYIIERKTVDGSYEIVGRTSGRSFIDNDATVDSICTYRIRAYNIQGASSYSEEIPITFGGNVSDARFPVESLRVWFKPDSLQEGPLGRWADDRNSNQMGVAATPANSPTVKANGLGTWPTVVFNGNAQVLTMKEPLKNLAEGEIFVLTKTSNPPGDRSIWNMGGNSGNRYPNSAGMLQEGFMSNKSRDLGIPLTDISKWHVYNVSSKTGEWVARLNGMVQHKDAVNSVYCANTCYLGSWAGSGTSYIGEMAEVLIFERVLTEAERQGVRNYLDAKYCLSGLESPAAPTQLKGIQVGSSQILLTWDGEVASGVSYLVERRTGTGGYELLGRVAGRSFVDNDALAGQTYSYQVSAANVNGLSEYSNEVSISPNDLISGVFSTSGLRAWYKPDRLQAGSVGCWSDDSPDQLNNAQSIATTSTPEAKLNGLGAWPTVKFYGAGTGNTFFRIPSVLTGATEGEVFVLTKTNVAKEGKYGGSTLMYFGGNGAGYPTATGTILEGFFSNRSKDIGAPLTDITQWHVYNASSKAGEWVARLNGEVQYTDMSNVIYNVSTWYLGSNYTSPATSYNGEVAEVLVYNRVLSDEERQGVQNYLNAKYSLTNLE